VSDAAPRATIWTTRRKVMGNLGPILACAPFGAMGVLTHDPAVGLAMPSLGYLVAFPVVGWFAVNLVAFFQNRPMRFELARKLGERTPSLAEEFWFVGIARPGFRSGIDPHEDVGFLIPREDRLEYLGDTLSLVIPRSSLSRVRFRPNVHTWVLVGGWISLEGEHEGQPIRLFVEPREKATLVGNLLLARRLVRRLRAWLA
jgi:hypothetical protein